MTEVKWSKPCDPNSFDVQGFAIPVRSNTAFVCYVCCANGTLENVDGHVVWDCPDHMRLVFSDSAVVYVERRGARH